MVGVVCLANPQCALTQLWTNCCTVSARCKPSTSLKKLREQAVLEDYHP
jgi:hypothetical protein